MENSEVLKWAINNKKDLQFKVKKLTGLPELMENFFDYSVSIKIEGVEFIGRGTDVDELISLHKAISEAIERYIAFKFKLENTSGISVHTSIDNCKKASLFELIERDSFLVHFLLGIKLANFSNAKTEKIKMMLIDKNIKLNFYLLSKINNGSCVMALAYDSKLSSPNKIFFGTCFNTVLEKSVEFAAIEAIRDYVHSKTDFLCYSIEQFNKLKEFNFEDHKLLGLNEEYTEMYFKTRKNDFKIKDVDIDRVEFKEVNLNELLYECPLKAVIGSSKNMQRLWIGKTDENVINFNRLNEITPGFKVLELPHFFN